MNKKKDKSHSRAPGMTQISISLPKRLVDKVDRLAELENRSRSNYIAFVLDRIPETDEPSQASFLKAAEPKAQFNA